MNAIQRIAWGFLATLVLAPACWGQTIAGPIIQPPAPGLWNLICPGATHSGAFHKQLQKGGTARRLTIGDLTPNHQTITLSHDSGVLGTVSIEEPAPNKQDDATLKERRDAVRYLGTVDCNRWPEAADRLVEALLKDASDDIRLEAAIALGKGNCCTPTAIHALQHSVNAKNIDGTPTEKSERVRKAAAEALVRCETGQKETPKVKDNNNNGEPRKTEPSIEELRARAAAVQLTYTPRADSVSAILSQAMGGRSGFMQDVRRQLTGRQEIALPLAPR